MTGAVGLFRVYLDGAAERVESWPIEGRKVVETRLPNIVSIRATLSLLRRYPTWMDDCTIRSLK